MTIPALGMVFIVREWDEASSPRLVIELRASDRHPSAFMTYDDASVILSTKDSTSSIR